jgi:hypothetical protein
MNIRAIYSLPHAGAVIAAGTTADLPENLARMLIARGQAEDAAAAPPAAATAKPASPPHAPVSATPRAEK